MTICTVCQKKLGLTEVTYNLDNTVQSNVVTEPVCKSCHEIIDNSILSFRNVKTVADIGDSDYDKTSTKTIEMLDQMKKSLFDNKIGSIDKRQMKEDKHFDRKYPKLGFFEKIE